MQQLEHDLPPDNATGITQIARIFVHRTAEQALGLEAQQERAARDYVRAKP